MNYRFEDTYTHAESVKWQTYALGLLDQSQSSMSLASALAVIVIQFCIWTPLFYILYVNDVPFTLAAPVLFFAYLAIGIFYDAVIWPHVAAIFDKDNQKYKGQKFNSVVEVDEGYIRTISSDSEVIFKWEAIRDIHDSASSVVLLTETGYCLIPARCFDGFLEQDAFVRYCSEKIKGKTAEGAIFT